MDEVFAAELEKVLWFDRTGQPLPESLPFDPLPVETWVDGDKYFTDPPWENV